MKGVVYRIQGKGLQEWPNGMSKCFMPNRPVTVPRLNALLSTERFSPMGEELENIQFTTPRFVVASDARRGRPSLSDLSPIIRGELHPATAAKVRDPIAWNFLGGSREVLMKAGRILLGI